MLHLKTPPKETSSPKRRTRGSVRRACERALLIAWKRFWRVVGLVRAEGGREGEEVVEDEVWV